MAVLLAGVLRRRLPPAARHLGVATLVVLPVKIEVAKQCS
jgi:hypothetical protein